RRVMALPASPEQRARAALSLTRPDCIDPTMRPLERQRLDEWRADVLSRVETTNLSETLKNRVQLRRAGVYSSLAYERSRQPDAASTALDAGLRALQALTAVNKTELADEDVSPYNEAAVRVGASRWAAEPGVPTVQSKPGKRPMVTTEPGDAG